jgi:CheY-like chemotaxis protein
LALDSYLYDVNVMDNFMPGMTAEKFVKEARSRREVKFVLMTATNCVAAEAARLGTDCWIGKPFQPDDLLAAAV